MYRTLSEVKSEIEIVIKTGRKLCEDKTTKNPKKLGNRIDALKHLYNSLGENVTQSKIILEDLSKIGKSLSENFEQIENWLKSQEIRNTNDEDINNGNITTQNIEDLLQKSSEMYEEYRQTCDAVYLRDTKEKLENFNLRFAKLTSADVLKILNEMKSNLQNIDTISLDSLRSMEEDLKKMKIVNSEVGKLHFSVLNIVQVRFVFLFILKLVSNLFLCSFYCCCKLLLLLYHV